MYRSRNVLSKIQSTARFMMTKNGKPATNSPIRMNSAIRPSAFIGRLELPMTGELYAILVARHNGAATHCTWIRICPASDSRTVLIAHITTRFGAVSATTLYFYFLKINIEASPVHFNDCARHDEFDGVRYIANLETERGFVAYMRPLGFPRQLEVPYLPLRIVRHPPFCCRPYAARQR